MHPHKIPVISVGHQFLFTHPHFPIKNHIEWSGKILNLATKLVGKGSSKKLALSFYPLDDYHEHNLSVIPPLIDTEKLPPRSKEGEPHFTVYLNRPGFLKNIQEWQKTIRIFLFSALLT